MVTAAGPHVARANSVARSEAGVNLIGSFLSGRAVKIGQVVIYLAMGWVCSLDMASLRAALSPTAFSWLLAGGLAYTCGVVFYVLDKMGRLSHAHGIWHIFVLAGSVCHFVAVIGFVR